MAIFCIHKIGLKGKPVFKGHSDEDTLYTVNLSSRDTLIRGHLYTVKPVFKGYSDEDTLYTVNLSSRDTLIGGHPLYSKPVFKGHSDEGWGNRNPAVVIGNRLHDLK